MNVCQEFFAENVHLQPEQVFKRLNTLAQAPFSVFFKTMDHALICASPERFLAKRGDKLISQPIKGTRKRSDNPETDQMLAQDLANSPKDRAENVMIVDLVRNDLTRHSQTGSIQVEELFKVYTFNTVHQLISTVVARLRPDAHAMDALRAAFPMGSMTGAPKVMAMQLIEHYECTRRGLYSGAFGYFSPEGDFDFNVVIRSILYNKATQYCSVQVGGAIVYDSDPEQEYEECMTKVKAMIQALAGQIRQDVINCT
jgi:para-aminobenzoate synthetase component 1